MRRGYAHGKTFITAFLAGHIDDEHVRTHVPVDFLDVLEGPSEDFMLGRLYEGIRDYVAEDIERHVEDPESETAVTLRARVLYTERNCALLLE